LLIPAAREKSPGIELENRMPIREFKCDNDHTSERILNGAADQTTTEILCNDCGQPAVRVGISRPSDPRLDGEGFYKPSASYTANKKGFRG
jgi:hypothetical protein